jgi:cytidylate kinase
MDRKIVIAIDGPAGAGKSSVAKDVAARLGLTYIDTGKMYRALTRHFLNNRTDWENPEQLAAELSKTVLEISGDRVYVNGADLTDQLRSPEINENVSAVASKRIVREKCIAEQKRLAKNAGIVMDGRDIGSVVLPDADLKIYLDASIEERAKRRMKEDGIAESQLQDLMSSIAHRDELDRTREESPLAKAADAILIDSTRMSKEQVVEKICALAETIQHP